MTNGEKYKTADERWAAFTAFCTGRPCTSCELNHDCSRKGHFNWLELEYKPAVNECPICGDIHADTIKVNLYSNDVDPNEFFCVYCRKCHMRGPEMESKEMAIEMWNKLRRNE